MTPAQNEGVKARARFQRKAAELSLALKAGHPMTVRGSRCFAAWYVEVLEFIQALQSGHRPLPHFIPGAEKP
jgi:hypothetical protein